METLTTLIPTELQYKVAPKHQKSIKIDYRGPYVSEKDNLGLQLGMLKDPQLEPYSQNIYCFFPFIYTREPSTNNH